MNQKSPMVVTAPRIAEALGSQSALARLCGVSQQSVSKWVLRNKELPAEHVLAVEHATGISRHDLRPDIYPREASAAAGDDRIEGVRP
ncbi:transcriptional regulator [Sphingobium scionense]|uniref:DNA-binding transcriptional regulator YdaS (Cro superfamily) n=1 Tax=Sphingobium scionense TaxID=1404341 RepID=A0A7W6LRD1_9SPHN|nr:YdaS family helix-turn-helix protein [Sphingobium scionense]MBB4149103.1 DNA-binding transcriptional regulator YdaS (Cro superfamily) [Sphingobium scionense]